MCVKTATVLDQSLLQGKLGIKFFSATLILSLFLSGTFALAREKPLDTLFKKADSDHNGLISEAEWHAEMQKRFESTDANHDGNISREELEKAKENMREKMRSMPLRERGGHMLLE